MSGIPRRYTRGQAIMHILTRRGTKDSLALYCNSQGEDEILSTKTYATTAEWLPRLQRVNPDGTLFGSKVDQWPSEEEIQAEIEESQARADAFKNHPNAMCVNDLVAASEILAGAASTKAAA